MIYLQHIHKVRSHGVLYSNSRTQDLCFTTVIQFLPCCSQLVDAVRFQVFAIEVVYICMKYTLLVLNCVVKIIVRLILLSKKKLEKYHKALSLYREAFLIVKQEFQAIKLILHQAPKLINTLPKQGAVNLSQKVAEIRKDLETSGRKVHSSLLHLPPALTRLCCMKAGNWLLSS